jgi:hypothetical protein
MIKGGKPRHHLLAKTPEVLFFMCTCGVVGLTTIWQHFEVNQQKLPSKLTTLGDVVDYFHRKPLSGIMLTDHVRAEDLQLQLDSTL